MAEPSLRNEAGPLAFRTMDPSQRQAIMRMLDALEASVQSVGSKWLPATTTTPIIEPERPNRVLFLDGDRGTGKTTVMVSLLQWMHPDVVEAQLRWPGEDEGSDFLPIRARIAQLSKKVVWLQPLDIEIQPEHFNPLSGLVVRIEDAIERSLSRSGGASGSEDRRHLKRTNEVLRRLEQLHIDATLAWTGMSVQRAANIDPDPYAHEVARTARARRRLAESFRDVLELAARDCDWGRAEDPLFVLVIDDFDLSPWHCTEILRILRMLSLPRLFTIVLGNARMLRTMDELSARGVLRGRSAGAAHRYVVEDANLYFEDEVTSRLARSLAITAIDKVVPMAQRVEVGTEVSVEHRLGEFRPRTDAKPLGALLGGQALQPEAGQADSSFWFEKRGQKKASGLSALSLFETQKLAGWDAEAAARTPPCQRGEGKEIRYVGRYAIEVSNRRLSDIYHLMSGSMDPGGRGTILYPWARLCLGMAETAWAYDADVPETARQRVQRWFEAFRRGLQVVPRFPLLFYREATEKYDLPLPDGARLQVNEVSQWVLADRDVSLAADRSTLAATALLFDASPFEDPHKSIAVEPVVRIFRTEADISHGWPVPPFETIYEADYHLKQLRCALDPDEDRTLPADVVELVWASMLLGFVECRLGERTFQQGWIDEVYELSAHRSARTRGEEPTGDLHPEVALDWQCTRNRLERALEALCKADTGRAKWARRGLGVLAAWLAPEHGSGARAETGRLSLLSAFEGSSFAVDGLYARSVREQAWTSLNKAKAIDPELREHVFAARAHWRVEGTAKEGWTYDALRRALAEEAGEARLDLPPAMREGLEAELASTSKAAFDDPLFRVFGSLVTPPILRTKGLVEG